MGATTGTYKIERSSAKVLRVVVRQLLQSSFTRRRMSGLGSLDQVWCIWRLCDAEELRRRVLECADSKVEDLSSCVSTQTAKGVESRSQ
jgi:hypothetical protein